MFLRRIIDHARSLHWTMVFIDLVIVVVGVFIGLQAQDWNQARADRAAEREYLARLDADATSSIAQMREDEDQIKNWRDEVSALIAGLEAADPAAVKAHRAGFAYSTRVDLAAPQLATITELIVSGRIGIIRNPKIRAAIAKAQSMASSRNAYLGILAGQQAALVPVIDTRFRFAQHISNGKAYWTYHYDFDALTKDQAFINALSSGEDHIRVNQYWLGEVIKEMEALRTLVEEERSTKPKNGSPIRE